MKTKGWRLLLLITACHGIATFLAIAAYVLTVVLSRNPTTETFPSAVLVIMFLTVPLLPVMNLGRVDLLLMLLPLNSMAYGAVIWLALTMGERLRRTSA